MPVGRRIRANNVFGEVDNNPLTAGGTSLTSSELPLLPEVAGNHAIITLDPLRTNGEPEIIVVNTHGPGASSATIARGQYGTVARQHPQGTVWVHAPLTDDVLQVVTSVSRPSDPYDGQLIYETDTDRFVGRIAGGWIGLTPPGVISAFGGSVAPTGYFLCDGTLRSTTTYAELFAVVGHEFNGGVDPGGGNFRLPNFQDRFPLGQGATFSDLGGTGGSKDAVVVTHTHTQNSHNHTQNSHNHSQNQHSHTHDHTGVTGSSGSHDHNGAVNGNVWAVSIGGPQSDRLGAHPADGLTGAFITFTNNDSAGAHQHGIVENSTPSTATNIATTATNIATTATNQNTGVSGTDANMPPYQIVNYIIKY